MFQVSSRTLHVLVLSAVYFALTLPNLGAHTFWDMDEGVNAEAAREMLESGNFVTPYYNYRHRTAKPVLLYWLQAASYRAFGVHEFGARFPSVLCGWITMLLVYELARRMFSPSTGLLAGIVLASCLEFCMISHAATPDPPLLMFTTATYFFIWVGSRNGSRRWFIPAAVTCGLSMLTKGPIGLAMPGLVVLSYLFVTRQLRRLLDLRLLTAVWVFVLVAAPWYGLVASDTKGEWPRAFFLKENVGRFHNSLEGHCGGPFYHLGFLILLFIPWSVLIAPTLWYAYRSAVASLRGTLQSSLRRADSNRAHDSNDSIDADESAPPPDHVDAHRFLLCWFLAYLCFFSVVATKLPNYVLPAYPALAILTARYLDRWRTGELAVPRWVLLVSAGCLVFTGAAVAVGMWVVGRGVPGGEYRLPGLEKWAWIGVIWMIAAVVFGRNLMRRPDRAVGGFAVGAAVGMGLLAAFPPVELNDLKPPHAIAMQDGLLQPDRDIRVGSYGWLRESTIFYIRREVTGLWDTDKANEFLAMPRPAYLLVSEEAWRNLEPKLTTPVRVVSRRRDMYSGGKEMLVIANEFAGGLGGAE